MDINGLIMAVIGGLLIGGSASLLLVFNGQIAGISGILGGLLRPGVTGYGWRAAFFGGLIVGGIALAAAYPQAFPEFHPRPLPWLIAAGLMVGIGTRLGAGCTSGHGVCGIGRLSVRSVAATMTFTVFGGLTVLVINRLLGGLS